MSLSLPLASGAARESGPLCFRRLRQSRNSNCPANTGGGVCDEREDRVNSILAEWNLRSLQKGNQLETIDHYMF